MDSNLSWVHESFRLLYLCLFSIVFLIYSKGSSTLCIESLFLTCDTSCTFCVFSSMFWMHICPSNNHLLSLPWMYFLLFIWIFFCHRANFALFLYFSSLFSTKPEIISSHVLSVLFFSCLGLCCCVLSFSSCSVQASHCGGFTSCRAWALGCRLQQLWHTGLVAP